MPGVQCLGEGKGRREEEIENTHLKFPHPTFRKHLLQWDDFILILSLLNMFYLGCGNG